MLAPELVKKIQRIFIKSRYLATDVFAGEYETAFRGRGIEFEEVREYIPGDDIRSIDWNVSARMGRPYVKIYREEREQTLMLVVDSSASQLFGSRSKIKKEIVCEIAALLAYTAIKSNDKVGLIIFSDRVERYIPPKKGRAHVWRVISEILSFKPAGRATHLGAALDFLNRVRYRRAVCFVISDFLTEDYEKPLRHARFRHDLIPLHISDPLEEGFAAGGLVGLRDLETGEYRLLDLTGKTRRLFEEAAEKRRDDREKRFRSLGLDSLSLKTTGDYIEPLLKFFKLREKRL